MKAVILAAGRGTRLSPLTDRLPKPMIRIGQRPLLEHIVRLLRSHGFDDLVLNLHHLPEAITDHFGDGSSFDVQMRYVHEPELLGTAGAVRNMARLGLLDEERFLVYYGDNLINADLTALWQDHARLQPPATIGLIWMPDPAQRGIVGLDATGRIDRIIEKPSPEQVFDDYLINAGVYAMGAELLQQIPTEGRPDFAADVFPQALSSRHELVGHRLQGQLLSTDTPERYEDACTQVDSGRFTLP